MDDANPDWDEFFDFGACEPAGTEAPGHEARQEPHIIAGIEREPAISYQTYCGYVADVDHWQPIIGPGSVATGYVALTDVAPVPPATHVSPDVDCDPTVTDEKLSTIDTELELAATWNVETSPVQATLSDLGDQVDEVHSSMFDSLEGCVCLARLLERRPVILQEVGGHVHRVHCRISPCTVHVDEDVWSAKMRAMKGLSLKDGPSKYKIHCRHESTHFEYQGNYKCAEIDCSHLTKQFRDLKRHYRAKHCTKTPEFPCSVLGCKFGGENGFHRKDKLASHYKSMHQGQAPSITHPRNIRPAPTRGGISGPGIGPSSK